jgi:hypothetical protein
VDASGVQSQWGLAYDPERDELYAAEQGFGNTRIHVVDPDNGAEFSLPNQVGYAIEELAFNTIDDNLYAVGSVAGQWKLIRINRTSGLGTIVGNTVRARGIDFDPVTGRIIALANAPARLWSIDPADGSATLLATPAVDEGWEGLAVIPLQSMPLATPGVGVTESTSPIRVAPNPSRTESVLSFEQPGPGPLEVDVYDTTGRHLRRLVTSRGAGTQHVSWDHRDGDGGVVAPGTYLVRIQGPGFRRVVKLVRLP